MITKHGLISCSGDLFLDKEFEDRHYDYLFAFSNTRRIVRDLDSIDPKSDYLRIAVGLPLGQECEFYTGAFCKKGKRSKIKDYNASPSTVPSLWCAWQPNKNGFSPSFENGIDVLAPWLKYLISNFIQPWGYILNGKVKAVVESSFHYDDPPHAIIIKVTDNQVEEVDLSVFG